MIDKNKEIISTLLIKHLNLEKGNSLVILCSEEIQSLGFAIAQISSNITLTKTIIVPIVNNKVEEQSFDVSPENSLCVSTNKTLVIKLDTLKTLDKVSKDDKLTFPLLMEHKLLSSPLSLTREMVVSFTSVVLPSLTWADQEGLSYDELVLKYFKALRLNNLETIDYEIKKYEDRLNKINNFKTRTIFLTDSNNSHLELYTSNHFDIKSSRKQLNNTITSQDFPFISPFIVCENINGVFISDKASLCNNYLGECKFKIENSKVISYSCEENKWLLDILLENANFKVNGISLALYNEEKNSLFKDYKYRACIGFGSPDFEYLKDKHKFKDEDDVFNTTKLKFCDVSFNLPISKNYKIKNINGDQLL